MSRIMELLLSRQSVAGIPGIRAKGNLPQCGKGCQEIFDAARQGRQIQRTPRDCKETRDIKEKAIPDLLSLEPLESLLSLLASQFAAQTS
jgi:hypothetical protein